MLIPLLGLLATNALMSAGQKSMNRQSDSEKDKQLARSKAELAKLEKQKKEAEEAYKAVHKDVNKKRR